MGERMADYNLPEILEVDQLEGLHGSLPGATTPDNEGFQVVGRDQVTVAALMGLLGLQAYLA